MSFEINAFLLAAGLGTRFQPLTLTYPKPAIPFLNVPMGFYQFRFLNHLLVENLVVNTFHLPEKVQGLYENQPYFKNKIHFSHEKGQILGSGGGLKKASAFMDLSKPILMMNADEIYITPDSSFLQKAYQQHVSNKNLATLIVMKHPEAGKKFGAIWCDGKRVKNIGKDATTGSEPWHYIGALFISADILAKIPDHKETNIFYDILINELKDQKVEIFPIDCSWYETGNPKDYLEATKEMLNHADTKLLDFISKYDKSDLVRNHQTTSLISKNISLSTSSLKGFNVVSKTASVSETELLENSVLFDNEKIVSGT